MTITLPAKPTLEEFIQTCTPLAIIEPLEESIRLRVADITAALLRFKYDTSENAENNLIRFLRADENFLGIILALSNLSQEKFLRILSAERFAKGDFSSEWGINAIHAKLRNEPEFAERIAKLFLDGRNSPLLVNHIAGFYLDDLSLPEDWPMSVVDTKIIQKLIRRKLGGEYTDKKGDAVEGIIRYELDVILSKYGLGHEKGQVQRGIDKEIDHAIPSLTDPYVMIMTSYMETTSSNQTTRANEQSEMFGIVQRENRRYNTKRVFVNFVDGAGWLARRSDLRKLHAGCDYIINLNTLDQLEAIICKVVPESYFTKLPRPEVQG